jgi:hypothetical protein
VPGVCVEDDDSQQDAFSVGAQQVVCFFGEQHEESGGAAFVASSLTKRVRFSGPSPLAGGASSGNADVLMMDLLSVKGFWTHAVGVQF